MLMSLNTPEDFLRHAFGYNVNDDSFYPDAQQRPLIYKAMEHFANSYFERNEGKKIRGYKKLLEILNHEIHISKLLFNNPEVLLDSPLTESDLEWAKKVIKAYEEKS